MKYIAYIVLGASCYVLPQWMAVAASVYIQFF